MQIPYVKVNKGVLHIVTPSIMYSVAVHDIQTITVANGLTYIHYADFSTSGRRASIQLHETYYPLIAEAITNA